MAVGHQVIVKYTYLDMCNGWVDGYVVRMGEWLHELFEVFFKFSAFHPISNILYPHDWIYIYMYICILLYIYCNIWYTCKYITKSYVVYLVHYMYHIYIIIYILHVLNVSFVSHTQENIRRALREVGQEPCYAAGGQARARKTPRRSVTTNRGSNMGFNHEQ